MIQLDSAWSKNAETKDLANHLTGAAQEQYEKAIRQITVADFLPHGFRYQS
jgi:hypothetical protein